MKDNIKKILNESLTKNEVEAIFDKKLNSNQLKKTIEKIVTDALKNNKEMKGKVSDISKDVLTQLYKTLWTKRSFWQSGIKK